jgi:hypothetical protein
MIERHRVTDVIEQEGAAAKVGHGLQLLQLLRGET